MWQSSENSIWMVSSLEQGLAACLCLCRPDAEQVVTAAHSSSGCYCAYSSNSTAEGMRQNWLQI